MGIGTGIGRGVVPAVLAGAIVLCAGSAARAEPAGEPAAREAAAKRPVSVMAGETRAMRLHSRARAVALVASGARLVGCPSHRARLSVRVGRRATVTKTVRSTSRRLRMTARVRPGIHRLRFRLRARNSCRVRLRGLAFEPAPPAPPPDLALAPRRAVPLGAAVDKRNAHGWYDADYPRVFVEHFDGLTVENALKMEHTWPRERSYDFTRADQIVDLAARNGRSVHGHTLVWDRQLPKWLSGRRWAPEDLAPRVQAYFGLMLGRYKDRITEWDVVNEPLTDDGSSLRPSVWLDTFGPAYVELAFRWADAANPDAKLFLNEHGIESPGAKADALLALVRDLLARGTPIDGVGFQFHLDHEPVRTDREVYDQLKRFTDLGLEVQVTEMDVAIPPAHRTDPHHVAAQAAQYTAVARACNALPACSRFTVWGVSDRYTWRGRDTAPLLLDAEQRPKPVYGQVRAAFAPVR